MAKAKTAAKSVTPKAVKADKGKSVIDHDKYKYGRTRIKNDDGAVKVVVSNGDAIARAMSHLKSKDLATLHRTNAIPKPSAKLNIGLQKMAIANSLRALVRSKVSVNVAGFVIKSLEQKSPAFADMSGTKAPARKPAGRKPAGHKPGRRSNKAR